MGANNSVLTELHDKASIIKFDVKTVSDAMGANKTVTCTQKRFALCQNGHVTIYVFRQCKPLCGRGQDF